MRPSYLFLAPPHSASIDIHRPFGATDILGKRVDGFLDLSMRIDNALDIFGMDIAHPGIAKTGAWFFASELKSPLIQVSHSPVAI
jgi:hypothetical protein